VKIILALIFLGLFKTSLILYKATKALPVSELRRRARSPKNQPAAHIYKTAARQNSAEALVWIVASISAFGFLNITFDYAIWLAILSVFVLGWMIIFIGVSADGLAWRVAGVVAQIYNSVLNFAEPLLEAIATALKSIGQIGSHNRIYEKEDLVELIKSQAHQADNRVDAIDLSIAASALSFGDKFVGSVMTPIKKARLVLADEPIGPAIMDELHQTGFTRFGVVKEINRSASPEIIGTIYFSDLLGHEDKGKIKDLMRKEVFYINETQNLRQALKAFMKTECHLLVVVNNFEEVVGLLAFEDVIEQILGQKITDEFERYNNLHAMAGQDAKNEHSEHEPHTA